MKTVFAAARAKSSTLKFFVLVASLLISFISFSVVVALTSYVFIESIESQADTATTSFSRHLLASLTQLMEKGWSRQELATFMEAQQKDEHVPCRVTMYRTAVVEKLYGPGAGAADADCVAACAEGRDLRRVDGFLVSKTYPLRATADCLGCHGNARPNQILGAVKVEQNIAPLVTGAWNRLWLFLGVLSPVPFGMSVLVSRFVYRRIDRATERLHNKVVAVNTVQDLGALHLGDIKPGFAELDRIFAETAKLAARIKAVSVDKETLESQLRRLEKFIVTSDVIADWKHHVGLLLAETSQVIPALFIVSVFRDQEDGYDIDIFWHRQPCDALQRRAEEQVAGMLKPHLFQEGVIQHTIVSEASDEIIPEQLFSVQTKVLHLHIPPLEGIVGMGIASEKAGDPTVSLVVDSILTTLLNLLGSIKAIGKYTRDLEHYATRDPLTNVYNQRVFWELLHYEIHRAERHGYGFCLMVLDLDNFKNINDTYGHSIGDDYLNAFTGAVQQTLRRGDVLARYGGDEFVVILPETEEEQALVIAQRIRQAVEGVQLSMTGGAWARATASIGVAAFPLHADNAKDLFVIADNMTYGAKEEGKNRVCSPSGGDDRESFKRSGAQAKVVLEAIERGAIIPYFQPIADLQTGEVVFHEALCRIEDQGVLLAASEFIETAERLGAVSRLDLLMAEKSLALMQEKWYGGSIFLNLAPRSFMQNDFIPQITALCRRYGIEHHRVVFELTERETVKNLALLETFVSQLNSRGFKFAIDDFGSGYSSFQYIRRFPIDFVKIDGEFIRNMATSKKDLAFVKTLAMLAKEFQIRVIAEYIEDEGVAQALRELGVDYGQGYLMGRPAPGFSA